MQQDLDWYFVKVKFQRVLSGEGMDDGQPQVSEWTRGYWTQYLPPASLFEEAGGKGDVAHLRLDRSGEKLLLTDANGGPVVLRPEAVDGDRLFALYLVVTEVIRDATGHRRERYLRLMSQGKDNEWLKEIKNETGELGTRALRARVLEVQCEPTHPDDVPDARKTDPKASLWERLFPAGEKDAAARIVRISAPISELRPPQETR